MLVYQRGYWSVKDWRAKQVSRDATKVGISYTGIWCQSLISSGAKMERELDSDSTSWADLNFKIHNLNISELDDSTFGFVEN